ncbi:MAG: phenylalanine--tRNA ligase subunit beta [Deltaproteobacteria bacterium]|nr:phenylalanine--tRNA ligase subunit beta [Deltaproteobacteria bacterium]
MLVSLRWLKDYVDIEMSTKELAGKLTMAGLEVESIEESGPGFTGVIVSRIDSVKPHPDSKKLSLCEVWTGTETLPIVCGAPNVAEGMLTPLATVGATIPGGYTIKRSRIRGELSEGMLCSDEELGIGDDASGIMALPDTLKPGDDLADALDLKDITFDVSITPNRSDCLSILGIAREIAAITGKAMRYPDMTVSESGEDIRDITSVDILSPDLCPRYSARIIRNVTVRPSPLWIKLRLEAVGLRAINNVVDVTNFIMMEMGQPLHAFDFRYLEEGRIVVRGAGEGEEFISLDEKTRTLRADTLMICDGVKPVAVAGIMGGLNSEVTDDTETVLLESAYFNPASIRRSSRALGMSTDAAFRFERGIDPEGVIKASNRAARLIAETSGGTVCRGFIDAYPRKIEPVTDIPLRLQRVQALAGITIEEGSAVSILKNLEMKVVRDGAGTYRVTPPTFRVDISREADLIEEITRIYGYDKIPVTLPRQSTVSEIRDRKRTLMETIRIVLNGMGYSEVINYSFTSPMLADRLNLPENDEGRRYVRIKNPLTEETSVMRTVLTYGFLETAFRNANTGTQDLKMFEMGKVFIGTGEDTLPHERERLGGFISGSRFGDLWHFNDEESDFYDLKGAVENVFDSLKIHDVIYRSGCTVPFLHPGRSCDIIAAGRHIGFLGEIHPDVLENMDLKNRVVIFELELQELLDLFTGDIQYQEIPRYPASSRDVAFVVDSALEAERIIDLARGKQEKLLENVCVFDVYSGKGIPEGMKSIALRFTYRSPARTLTDEEVNASHKDLVDGIVKTTGAKIRGMEV